MRAAVTTAFLGTALLLAGCGGSTADTAEGASTSAADTSSAATTAPSSTAEDVTDELTAEDYEAALLPITDIDAAATEYPTSGAFQGSDPFGFGGTQTSGEECLARLPVYPDVELRAASGAQGDALLVNQYISQSTTAATALDPDNMRSYWQGPPCEMFGYDTEDGGVPLTVEIRPVVEADAPAFGDNSLVVRFDIAITAPSEGGTATMLYAYSLLATDGERAIEVVYFLADGQPGLDAALDLFTRAYDYQHAALA